MIKPGHNGTSSRPIRPLADGPDVAAPAASRTLVRRESRLLAQCLAGKPAAWEQLYSDYHPHLQKTIAYLLGPTSSDIQLVDEIAARVWFALVRDNARLLARFDPERHSTLGAYLAGTARIEVLRYRRSERRRKQHEWLAGVPKGEAEELANGQVMLLLQEFASTLTPAEREYFDDQLMTPASGDPKPGPLVALSSTNVWQRRHRIRRKLRDFIRPQD